MKRRSGVAAAFLLLALLVFLPVKAEAAWVKKSSGSYVWKNTAGKILPSEWIPSKKAGFVKVGSTTYCYKLNGSKYRGWLTNGSKRYYIDKDGKMLKSKWIRSKNKKYYASKNGAIYKNCLVKIGKYKYGFDSNGVMKTGKSTIKNKTYYFSRSNGRMQTKVLVKISGKKYYFGDDGTLRKKVWLKSKNGMQYVNSKGYVETSAWVGKRYLDSDGYAKKGLQKIGGVYYYFDSKYNKITNTSKTINGVKYTFDKNGKGTVGTDSNETDKPSVSVQSTYYTDPKVSDEVLLSAIIYCEAGNQPYYGQLGVGLVITNRMRSSKFPDKLKEVVYQTTQFSPTFDGALTRALKNQSLITASCKKAAREVLQMYRANKYTIKVNGKSQNMKDHLFFMTKGAYNRLGLTSPIIALGDHVFFKVWQK